MNNKIKRFDEYRLESMVYELMDSFDFKINESDKKSDYDEIYNNVISDLKLNFNLITTFGAGIGALYPVVNGLIFNTGQSIELTTECVVLSTICAISIICLEEKKFKNTKQQDDIRRDAKTLLEELKMKGIGNGIIKKLSESLKSIKSIFYSITKHLGATVGGFMDMFAYTSMLIPVMNAIYYMIDKYEFNIDTLTQNFLSISMGICTVIAKRGISYLIDKIKNRLPIDKKKVIDSIETPIIQKFGDIIPVSVNIKSDSELIKD
jgi:hypothetical protein